MSARPLSPFEEQEARLVFADGLRYDQVRIVEGADWPDWLARLGARLSGAEPPAHNAVTLGNRIHFPVSLRTSQPGPAAVQDMAWLIHELTHIWQYQHRGVAYLLQALMAQIRLGPGAYDYGSEAGLQAALGSGRGMKSFNPEQQGDITRDYYLLRKRGEAAQPWESFVAEIRTPPPRA